MLFNMMNILFTKRYSVTIKINQAFYIFNTSELPVKRTDLGATILVGPTREKLALDPPSCTSPRKLTIYPQPMWETGGWLKCYTTCA